MLACGLIYFVPYPKDGFMATQSTADLGAKIMLSVDILRALALSPGLVLADPENFFGKIKNTSKMAFLEDHTQ